MELQDIILIPVYVFVALRTFKLSESYAWINRFLKLFKFPNHLEQRLSELENRIKMVEENLGK